MKSGTQKYKTYTIKDKPEYDGIHHLHHETLLPSNIQPYGNTGTSLGFRRSSSVDDHIHTVKVKVDVPRRRKVKKRVRKRRKNRNELVEDNSSSAYPLSSSAVGEIVPVGVAVPTRWKKFRSRRLPRFLRKGQSISETFSTFEESMNESGLGSLSAKVGDEAQSKYDKSSPQLKQKNVEGISSDVLTKEEQKQTLEGVILAEADDHKEKNITIEDAIDQSEGTIKEKNTVGNKDGRRVEFSATEKSTRTILLDEKLSDRFIQYMNQPVENYSLFSVLEQQEDQVLLGRRFNVRRLTKDESICYQNANEIEGRSTYEFKDNYFRLAAPLMPLIGLDLTPIIDLEVTPTNMAIQEGKSDKSIGESYNENEVMTLRPLGSRWRNRISSAVNRETNRDMINIRSVRVDLLSNDEDVKEAMASAGDREKIGNNSKGIVEEVITQAPPTALSSDQSIQEFGNEAIGLFGKAGELFHPHVNFDSSITWSIVNSNNKNKEKDSKTSRIRVTLKSTVVMSLNIPSLPFAIPSTIITKQIGSMIAKRILGVTLPRFLKQLERDFRRWSNTPANERTGTENNRAED